ncbi:MAG: apolipoprotein N-acyltransferase [Deltaproteobacteria bacterium]|nr:apolipoprotein N-acyltransferase [Deltaproteobacteria bacterium]
MSSAAARTVDAAAAKRTSQGARAARFRTLALAALPFVSSLVLVASFPPLAAAPLAWVGIVPLLIFLRAEPSAWRRVAMSGCAGTLFFALGTSWLTRTTTPGWLALAVYAGGLSWALFAALAASALRSDRPWLRALGPAAAWVLSEYARGVLPANLPWLYLAHSQATHPSLVQSAAWGGAWLASALVVIVNAALASAARPRHAWVAVLGVGAIVVLASLTPSPSIGRSLRVGIVQPELGPREKTDPALRAAVLDRLTSLSREVTAPGGADVIVWPESSFPRTVGKEPGALLELAGVARGLGRPLVTGVMTKSDHLRNSVVALDGGGRVTSVYDKQRLVFVAEYLPSWIRNTPIEGLVTRGVRLPHRFDFAPGDGTRLLDVAGIPAAAAICLEHVSFAHVRAAVAAGARLVLNVGNEAAFQGTAELDQALAIATLRAVENRVAVVRVLNSGLSGVIAPDGTIRTLPLGARAEVVEVPLAEGARTPYTVLGEWVVWASAALLGALRLGAILSRRPHFTVRATRAASVPAGASHATVPAAWTT